MHRLEENSFFPYVAWILVISFALFTIRLTYELQKTVEYFDTQITVPR